MVSSLRMASWLWLAAALGVAASSAHAQDATTAEAAFARGVAAADAGAWPEAEEAFSRACEQAPTPSALLNLATARYHQDKAASALAALDRLESLPSLSEAERQTARRMRERVTPLLSRLSVQTDPAEADVRLDGHALGAERRRIPIDPGLHVVVAEAPGFVARSVDVEVQPGEHRGLQLPLRPEVDPLPSEVAALPAQATQAPEAADDRSRSTRRRRWLWAAGAMLVAGVAVAVAVPLAGRDPACSSADLTLGGCAR